MQVPLNGCVSVTEQGRDIDFLIFVPLNNTKQDVPISSI